MTLSRSTLSKMFKPLGEGLTTEQVVIRVRELIQSGELRQGDRLPSERELARRLGISRPSLRTGLRFLSAMGVLESRHGAGTFISTGPPELDSQPLRLMAALHGFAPDSMFEARRVLEIGMAGLAAERATDVDLAAMAEEVAEMYASLDNPQEYLVHDVRFHRAIAGASDNPVLATLMEMVSALLYEQRSKTVERATDLKESAEMHRKIYQAIRARKPDEARESMSEHLKLAQRAFANEEAVEKERGKSQKREPGIRSRLRSEKKRTTA